MQLCSSVSFDVHVMQLLCQTCHDYSNEERGGCMARLVTVLQF